MTSPRRDRCRDRHPCTWLSDALAGGLVGRLSLSDHPDWHDGRYWCMSETSHTDGPTAFRFCPGCGECIKDFEPPD